MPFSNIITTHITDEQYEDLNDALDIVEAILLALTQNLTPEERQRYGSVNEQNKLFVNKINDYHLNKPELQSPDVDWTEFEKDFKSRRLFEAICLRLGSLDKMATDAKTLHDFDNYQNALTDYDYTQYKNNTSGGSAWSVKEDELRQFFPRTT